MTNINSITAISTPYPDGQRVTALAIEYSAPVSSQSIADDSFEVPGRTITSVCTAASPAAQEPGPGNYVIIGLDPKDLNSSTITDLEGKHPAEKKAGPRPKRRPPEGGGRPPMGPPERVLPDGRIFAGPSGINTKREPLAVKVRQLRPIAAEDGTEIDYCSQEMTSDKEINIWADLFTVEHFEDIEYNLFVPQDYDPDVKYPVVLFIHDAGVSSLNVRVTLEQGIGATIFASPEEQKKHPCIIVAPQHEKELPIANDKYWCFDDIHTYKRLLDDIQTRYSVDPDRIYTTGQSMGFMVSLQLMIEYPDYFAAGLVPAGHWDIGRTATLWNQNLWMFVSEPDKGGVRMLALPEAVEKIGGHMGMYTWDADQPTSEISKLIESVENDGNTFHLTYFPGESIMRPNQPDRTDGGGHDGTWHFVYQIEAVRDWLFKQRRNR